MNAATILLKSVLKTDSTPRPKGTRIQDMVSTANRRELAAAGVFKLSRPMDEATALHLAQQRTRLIKWGAHVWPRR